MLLHSYTLFRATVLIPSLQTHTVRIGLQFVLFSHHLELLYLAASASIEFRVEGRELRDPQGERHARTS